MCTRLYYVVENLLHDFESILSFSSFDFVSRPVRKRMKKCRVALSFVVWTHWLVEGAFQVDQRRRQMPWLNRERNNTFLANRRGRQPQPAQQGPNAPQTMPWLSPDYNAAGGSAAVPQTRLDLVSQAQLQQTQPWLNNENSIAYGAEHQHQQQHQFSRSADAGTGGVHSGHHHGQYAPMQLHLPSDNPNAGASSSSSSGPRLLRGWGPNPVQPQILTRSGSNLRNIDETGALQHDDDDLGAPVPQSPRGSQYSNSGEMTCAICLGTVAENRQAAWAQLPGCLHSFHLDCVRNIAKVTTDGQIEGFNTTTGQIPGEPVRPCPLCRNAMTAEDCLDIADWVRAEKDRQNRLQVNGRNLLGTSGESLRQLASSTGSLGRLASSTGSLRDLGSSGDNLNELDVYQRAADAPADERRSSTTVSARRAAAAARRQELNTPKMHYKRPTLLSRAGVIRTARRAWVGYAAPPRRPRASSTDNEIRLSARFGVSTGANANEGRGGGGRRQGQRDRPLLPVSDDPYDSRPAEEDVLDLDIENPTCCEYATFHIIRLIIKTIKNPQLIVLALLVWGVMSQLGANPHYRERDCLTHLVDGLVEAGAAQELNPHAATYASIMPNWRTFPTAMTAAREAIADSSTTPSPYRNVWPPQPPSSPLGVTKWGGVSLEDADFEDAEHLEDAYASWIIEKMHVVIYHANHGHSKTEFPQMANDLTRIEDLPENKVWQELVGKKMPYVSQGNLFLFIEQLRVELEKADGDEARKAVLQKSPLYKRQDDEGSIVDAVGTRDSRIEKITGEIEDMTLQTSSASASVADRETLMLAQIPSEGVNYNEMFGNEVSTTENSQHEASGRVSSIYSPSSSWSSSSASPSFGSREHPPGTPIGEGVEQFYRRRRLKADVATSDSGTSSRWLNEKPGFLAKSSRTETATGQKQKQQPAQKEVLAHVDESTDLVDEALQVNGRRHDVFEGLYAMIWKLPRLRREAMRRCPAPGSVPTSTGRETEIIADSRNWGLNARNVEHYAHKVLAGWESSNAKSAYDALPFLLRKARGSD
ncbi:unnamed protein product [Amoebophrya sp. A25]|nr:unnamed protein product [Amoebophrya sp. A25]|eukprot:GSA25T00007671001.1